MNINSKPYKITYISLDSNFDIESHKQLQQDIKNIKNILSKEEHPKYYVKIM